jgi:hypothetical protein
MFIKSLEEKFVKSLCESSATFLKVSSTFFWDSQKYWDTLGLLPLDPGVFFLMHKTPSGPISCIVIIHEWEIGRDVSVEIFKYVGGRVAGSLHYFSDNTALTGAFRGMTPEKYQNELACCLAPIASFQYMPTEEMEKEDDTGLLKKSRRNCEKTNDTPFSVSFLTRAYFNRAGRKLHKVRSFPRKQRVGVGRKEIKIVWVKEHTRGNSI